MGILHTSPRFHHPSVDHAIVDSQSIPNELR
jgi:hypothetical protein